MDELSSDYSGFVHTSCATAVAMTLKGVQSSFQSPAVARTVRSPASPAPVCHPRCPRHADTPPSRARPAAIGRPAACRPINDDRCGRFVLGGFRRHEIGVRPHTDSAQDHPVEGFGHLLPLLACRRARPTLRRWLREARPIAVPKPMHSATAQQWAPPSGEREEK